MKNHRDKQNGVFRIFHRGQIRGGDRPAGQRDQVPAPGGRQHERQLLFCEKGRSDRKKHAHRPVRQIGRLQHQGYAAGQTALLHNAEIAKISGKINRQGYTLVPLKLYFKDSLVKMEVALCRGKHTYDKKQSIAERDLKRAADRAVKNAGF